MGRRARSTHMHRKCFLLIPCARLSLALTRPFFATDWGGMGCSHHFFLIFLLFAFCRVRRSSGRKRTRLLARSRWTTFRLLPATARPREAEEQEGTRPGITCPRPSDQLFRTRTSRGEFHGTSTVWLCVRYINARLCDYDSGVFDVHVWGRGTYCFCSGVPLTLRLWGGRRKKSGLVSASRGGLGSVHPLGWFLFLSFLGDTPVINQQRPRPRPHPHPYLNP